jgi:Tol biopolymer transport system component
MSNAVWSSDGKRFVMRHTSENDQSRDLVAIDAATGATTDVVRVDDAVGVKSFVAWAPDNERLAFLGFDAGDSALPTPLRLYVARVDGSGVAEVATGGREPYGGSSLSWSPDGRWIAANLIEQVTSQAGTETRAYAIGVTGSDLLPLGGTSLHPNSYDVAWSPDSGSVASLGSEQGRYVVAFAPLDGVAPAAADIGSSYSGPLTAYIEFVVWNPSGGRLFYALRSCGQGGCGNSEVYMVDATLTDAQPITNGGARFLGFVP